MTVCITRKATRYLRWEKIDYEKAEYYNAYPYADIYQTDPKYTDKVIVKYGPTCRFDKDIVMPPTKHVTISGKQFFAPRNATGMRAELFVHLH